MSDGFEISAALNDCANHIRAIGKRAFEDVVEIGRILTKAKSLAGHGNWLPWLQRELGWSGETARKWMSLYDFSKSQQNWNLTESDLPISSLYILAQKKTPPAIIDAVAERFSSGEPSPSAKEIKSMIAASNKQPTITELVRSATEQMSNASVNIFAAQEERERTAFARLEKTADDCLAANPDMQTAITDFIHRIKLENLERALAESYLRLQRRAQ
jgi:Protein of unknown function (DUF3102)